MILLALGLAAPAPAQVLVQDSLALVALYNSTNGKSWSDNTNWLSGPINTWYGVTISGSRVTELNLHDNNLSGTIPPAIGNLDNLMHLELWTNQLTGSIPGEIGNLSNLTSLSLDGNQLTDSIPLEITNLSNLMWLWLNDNRLTGSIPVEIGNLTQLTALMLHGNQLDGSIPPEIGDLADLEFLYLHSNHLTGAVPVEIKNLARLKYLYLNNNQLDVLDTLSALQYLHVQNNRFTFEDIEPNIEVASTEFIYAPQDSIYSEKDTTIFADSSLTLFISVEGTANQYQWMKNGVDLPGADSDSLTITSATYMDSGEYLLRITNTIATNLTLFSRPTYIAVFDTLTPAPPQNLTALEGDSSITLTWNQNLEADFLCYRIYSSTAPDPIALIDSTTSITDTIKTISGLANDTTYYFRITAVDTDIRESDFSNEVSATPSADVSIANRNLGIPAIFALHQNYPNPFNPSTTLRFDLPEAAEVYLVVYDLLGREVIWLVNGHREAGYHRVVWNGRTTSGREVPTGLYIARLFTPTYTRSIKLLLLK